MNGPRLRILYVAAYEPSELAVRGRLLMGEIARRHDVCALTLRRRSSGTTARITSRQRALPSTLVDKLLAARRLVDPGFPMQAIACASRGLRLAVQREIEQGGWDLVHVEHVRALQYLPERRMVPVLVDAVDCVSCLFERASRHRAAMVRRVFAAEAGRLHRSEAMMLRTADRVVVAAERDAAALRAHGARQAVGIVSNPVDDERFFPGPPWRPKTVVMTGKMSYHANAIAARWLCSEIWPLVLRAHPDAQLLIAGAQPSRGLRRLRSSTVEVTGWVPRIGEVVRSAAVAVAPLRYAAGIQNKVLEALACATPVVATPEAVGDLELRDGRDVVVAATADDIAAEINRLLADPAAARAIAEAGLRRVKEHHSVAKAADRLEMEYFHMLGLHRPVRTESLVAAARG